MQFDAQIVIERPRDDVAAAWVSPRVLDAWGPELDSSHTVDFERGRVGSRTRISLRTGLGWRLQFTSLVVASHLPESVVEEIFVYGLTLRIHTSFTATDSGNTLVNQWVTFPLPWWKWPVARSMHLSYRRKSRAALRRFKRLVEDQE